MTSTDIDLDDHIIIVGALLAELMFQAVWEETWQGLWGASLKLSEDEFDAVAPRLKVIYDRCKKFYESQP